jgi:flagellar biogenesis protein FliO
MNQISNFEFIECNASCCRASAVSYRPVYCRIIFALLCIVSHGGVCQAQTSDKEFRPRLDRKFDHLPVVQGTWESPNPTPIQETGFTQQVDVAFPTQCDDTCDIASSKSVESSHSGPLQSAKNWLALTATKLFADRSTSQNGPDLKRIFGALAIVLGSYFALVWLLRFVSPTSNTQLPRDVLEVLGKTPFGNKQHLQLVRLGTKLLLLLETPDGIQPIAEVSDPLEAEHLVNLCDPKFKRRTGRPSILQNPSAANSQAYSFRIPAMENATPNPLLPSELNNPRLSDVVRIVENASRQEPRLHRTTYQA